MLQLLFPGLPSDRVQPTNLLPTGVIITSNNHHRRLLPTECFGPPTKSILGSRTEPSLLSNQSLRSLQGWANLKPLPSPLQKEPDHLPNAYRTEYDAPR